ncbi:MAG: hypothetical protein U9R19_14500 [Bacteroidota bacterium]|nr:hypothetical protein [Bacteroidota bacterium]
MSGNLLEIFVYDGAVFFITDKIITPGLCDNLVYDKSGVLNFNAACRMDTDIDKAKASKFQIPNQKISNHCSY